GTEEGDGLAGGDRVGQVVDEFGLGFHLIEVILAVLVPGDRRTVLAVEVGVQVAARSELGPPFVPGLVLLRQGARPVAADEQAKASAAFARGVPARGPERHVWGPL